MPLGPGAVEERFACRPFVVLCIRGAVCRPCSMRALFTFSPSDGSRSYRRFPVFILRHGETYSLVNSSNFFFCISRFLFVCASACFRVTPEFYHFPGNADVGMDAFAETMPFKALCVVPAAGLWQIAAAMFAVEVFRINRVIRGDAPAGDLGLGQGEGARWNPFGLNYDADEFKAMQLREIKNGRLAMIGIMGMFLQASATGTGLIEQLSGGFSVPEAAAKAGYYFPGGL
ncbi:unnamed protein product [Phaeothamnion confervicola]